MTVATTPPYDRSQAAHLGDRAVVVGAGVAGLCTARILADYFDSVTVIEQDELPTAPEPRRNVPQGQHVHSLFTSGTEILDELLPGFSEDLTAAGGVEADLGSDWKTFTFGGYLADSPTRHPIFSASRPLIEQVLRRCVVDFDAIEIRAPCHFIEYLADEHRDVQGVAVRTSDGEETIAADLVVDATGRNSQTPSWLDDHGYRPPPVDEVTVDVGYSTCLINRPPEDCRSFRILPHDRGRESLILPIENDQWMVTLVGRGDDHPPADPEGLRTFAEGLAAPDVKELLDEQEWISEDIARYPFPSNRRYRYENLERFPDGLVVIGDAITSFNPAYGQGMSVAAMESVVLHDVLGEAGLDSIAKRFFDRVGPVVDSPWFFATALDSLFPVTSGPVPDGVESYQEYMAHLIPVAHNDGQVAEALTRVIQLEQPPSSLVRPAIARRVFGSGEEDSRSAQPPSWVPSAIRDVWPLIDDNLDASRGVLDWPGLQPEVPVETAGDN